MDSQPSPPQLPFIGDTTPTVFTVGHSTRTLEELFALLKHYNVERLVDIRHFPVSRHNPQFGKSVLEQALPAEGIEYVWLERLGGYREGGYLAYSATEAFRHQVRLSLGAQRLKAVAPAATAASGIVPGFFQSLAPAFLDKISTTAPAPIISTAAARGTVVTFSVFTE